MKAALAYMGAIVVLALTIAVAMQRHRNAKRRHASWCMWWQTFNEAGECSCRGAMPDA